MPGSIYHRFTSPVPDGTATSVVRPSDWNSAHTYSGIQDGVSLSGNTSGALANISSGTLYLAGGNNVTLSQNGNSVTISGANTAGGGVNQAAGTQTATSGTVVFSNSNGISFGMSGSTQITASYTVPNTNGLISNVNVSGGTTSNNLSAITFSNSNGVSFGLNGSTLTGSVATNYQSQGAYLTTAALSQDSSKYAGTNGAITGGSITVNTSGVSVNLPAYLTTAMISNAATISNVNLSAGTTSQNLSNFVLSNSNGVSFGLNGSTVTASYTVPSTAGLVSAINVSAGTTSNNLSAITFSNSNGISFGLNASTITASYTVPTVPAQLSVGESNVGNTSGNTGLVTAQLVLAGGNNITLSGSTNGGSMTITVSGANVGGAQTGISGVADNAGTQTKGTISFANSNGVTFGLSTGASTGTITASVAAQSNQSVGIYASSNTYLTSSGTVDARSLSFRGDKSITVGISASEVLFSVGAYITTADLSQNSSKYAQNWKLTGNTSGTTSSAIGTDLWIAGGNNITVSGSSNSITISGANVGGAQTGISSIIGSGGTQTNGAVSFAASNGITFGMSTGAVTGTITASYTVPSTNGLISAVNVSAGTTSNNLTNVVFSNSNGVSFGLNGSTVTGSIAAPVAQTNQTLGLYGVGNTTQNSSTTLDARTVSYDGLGGITVGFSNGSVQISGPQTVAQTNQSIGLYAVGTTAGASSTTVDARSVTVSGWGPQSVGLTNGSLQVSLAGALYGGMHAFCGGI